MVEARPRGAGAGHLAGNAEVAAPDPAVAQQRRQDRVDGIDRHREAQSLTAGDDGGVDADDRPVLVTSGPPELPG